MTLTWENKVGVWKCNDMSKKLRYAAITDTTIFQFASPLVPKEEKTRKRKRVSIAISEIGRGIELPVGFKPFLVFDSEDPIQKQLIWQLKNVLDRCSAHGLKLGSVAVTRSGTVAKRMIPQGKWNQMQAILAIASGYMSCITEPYDGMSYIGIGGSRLIRRIKQFTKIIPTGQYLREGDVLYHGEVGQTNNNIRWVECKDTNCFLGDGVVFGDHGLAFLETITPELRFFELTMCWYGVMAFGGQKVLYIPDMKRRRK